MQAVDNSCFNFILRTRCPYWRAFATFLFNAFHIGVGLRTNFSMRPAINPCWRALRTNYSVRRVILHIRVRLRTKYSVLVQYLHLVLAPLPCTTTSCRPFVLPSPCVFANKLVWSIRQILSVVLLHPRASAKNSFGTSGCPSISGCMH